MNIAEAIETLKSESCYECCYGCNSPYYCENTSCQLSIAAVIAVRCMEYANEQKEHKQ
jgi:hypothetical protein